MIVTAMFTCCSTRCPAEQYREARWICRWTRGPAEPWRPGIDDLVALIELVDRCGYDSVWVGDHIALAVRILDPLLQLAQAAVVSARLTLATAVYLSCPCAIQRRSPNRTPHSIIWTEGRLIFGVGVGGEFPKEYEAFGVPIGERGARLSESIDD
jgi:alkanesulfonate monooxygenase SsuD/methylene tetrahydromethanopterin reductase-like flavin-dependent oxidoreductase (luciferase family)